MKILTASQIRRIDRESTENYGIPGVVLMENAGMRVVEAIAARSEDIDEQSFVILCGKGNNGGDGFVVARQLIRRGVDPAVFLFAEPESLSGDARTNYDILSAIGHPPEIVRSSEEWRRQSRAHADADVVVDGLLGTGLTRPVEGLLSRVIGTLDDDFPTAMVVSIDVPSGCAADVGRLEGFAVNADLTVTFTALKHCLVFFPACQRAGEVVLADIGNPADLLDTGDPVELLDTEAFPELEFGRDPESNKGDYGRVLVVGGSRGKSGAAAMAARAAMASGAGLVTAAVPVGVQALVAASMAEIMTEGLGETATGTLSSASGSALEALVAGKSVVAIGPGIGLDDETQALVRDILPGIPVPVVLDADGLNAFAGRSEMLSGRERTLESPIVITPHPGEMARLIGSGTAHVVENRLQIARDFAAEHQVIVVLKGFRTVISLPDGRTFINPTGNPGMASGGTGDILTGMIAGLLGQPHLGTLVERLCLAVYLHGLAGDLAAAERGEQLIVATDILEHLPGAWSKLARRFEEH